MSCLTATLPAQPHTLEAEHYTTADGLSHNAVYNVQEDSRGLIWLTTRYGVNRFDGQEFRTYTKETHGLHTNFIGHVYEDRRGMVWFLSGMDEFINGHSENPAGYTIFDPLRERVISPETYLPERLREALRTFVTYLLLQDGSIVFIDDRGGLVHYTDAQTISYHELGRAPNLSDVFRETSAGEIAFSATDTYKYYLYNLATRQLERRVVKQSDSPGITHTGFYVQKMTTGKLISPVYKEGDTRFQRYRVTSEDRDSIYDLAEQFPGLDWREETYLLQLDGGRGHYWLREGNNVSLITAGERRSATAPGPATGRKLLARILSGGSLYVTDRHSGLYVYRARANVFTKAGLPGVSHRDFTRDERGKWWLGISISSELLGLYPEEEGYEVVHNHGVMRSKDGSVWSGVSWLDITMAVPGAAREFKRGLLTRRYPDGTTRTYPAPDFFVPNIWGLWEHPHTGLIYSAGVGGEVHLTDPDSGVSKRIMHRPAGALPRGTIVYGFTLDATGTVWASSSNGLYQLNERQEIVATYSAEGVGVHKIPSSVIHHTYIDAEGIFWLSTGDAGLIRWSPQGKLPTRQYTITDGLPSMVVHAAYEDSLGYLWLPTEAGIAQFNPAQEVFRVYTPENGTSDLEYNRLAHFRDTDGTLYFGGMTGITGFHPRDFHVQQQLKAGPGYLTIADVFQIDPATNLLVNTARQLAEDGEIVLAPNYARARLRFNDIRRQSTPYLITTQLSNVDKQPRRLDGNELILGNLPFGTSELYLRARNVSGELLEEQRITIRVLRPFYFQLWFLTLVGLAVFGIARGLAWLENRRLRNLVSERTRQIEADKQVIQQQTDELRQLDELKSRFFTNISHELRTPLTLISGPVKSLLRRNDLPAETFDSLHRIHHSSEQLRRLVNDILELTKLEEGKLGLQDEPVAIAEHLARIVGQFQSLAEERGVALTVRTELAAGLTLLLDRGKVETVLRNLIVNALKFTPRGGEVAVRAAYTDGVFSAAVADTGRGVAAQDLPQLFDRFYQARHGARTAVAEGGTGIGLAICRELLTLMGGDITVSSTLGAGSTFTFSFPAGVAARHSLAAPLPAQEGDGAQVQGKFEKANPASTAGLPHLLVVEDKPDLRRYLHDLLSSRYRVTLAENGRAALTHLESGDDLPELIITDLMMPVMDGFALLRRLKADPAYRLLPTVVLSARAATGDRLHALRTGVDDYILKPFEETELLQRISNLLGNARARREALTERITEAAPAETTVVPAPATLLAPAAAPLPTVLSSSDEAFLEAVEALIRTHLANPDFGNAELAELLFTSSRTLSRRLKLLSGLTTNKFMLEIRLDEARRLLETEPRPTLSTVASAVGFSKAGYLSSRFRERFGVLPSDYHVAR